MTTKFKGLEEAVKDYNEYQGSASIMIDKETGEVWTDRFISNNEWNVYHSDSVQMIYNKNNMLDQDSTISLEKAEFIASKIMENNYESYGDMIYDLAGDIYAL